MACEDYEPQTIELKPVLFIKDGECEPLRDSKAYPFLINQGGKGRQSDRPEGALITMAPIDPARDLGTKYTKISHSPKEIQSTPPYPSYWITAFDFHAKEVAYQALPATKETVLAFGMTLLKAGECVRFPYDGLVMTQYTYGKWAGHQSPYIEVDRRLDLLTINATDLEYHNFAHVFFSQDSVPLVISVARWRPYVNEIALADLWVAPGDAIVLPPKLMPPAPEPGTPYDVARRIVLDLHGNRNSAFACWPDRHKPSLSTTTILANAAGMSAPDTKPHYHEEPAATRHEPL